MFTKKSAKTEELPGLIPSTQIWVVEIMSAKEERSLRVFTYDSMPGFVNYAWDDDVAESAVAAEDDIYETITGIVQHRFNFTPQQMLFEIAASVRRIK